MPNMNGDLSLISLNGHLYSLFSCFVITFSFCSKTQQKYEFVVLLQIKLPFKALEAVFIGLLTIITKYFQIHYNKFSSYTSLIDVEYCRIDRVKNFYGK